MKFADKVVVVTGGTSGIGLEMASPVAFKEWLLSQAGGHRQGTAASQ